MALNRYPKIRLVVKFIKAHDISLGGHSLIFFKRLIFN